MKKILSLSLVAITFFVIFIATKPKTDKFGPQLKYAIENSTDSQYSVYIYLKDKGPNAESMLSNPLSLVTQRSLDRRTKVLPAGHLVDISDVPLYEPYKNEVVSKVLKLRQELKWFNAVSADVSVSQLNNIANLNYVTKIELVEKFRKIKDDVESKASDGLVKQSYSTDQTNSDSLSYGLGSTQITQIKVNLVHDIGVFGQGVMIASFDNGWRGQSHQVFTTLPMTIKAQYDFQLHIPNAYSIGSTTTHGTMTLSLVGGYYPGQMIGPAFKSMFIVARTEVDTFERPIEMDNWVAATEWADSLGADVITSSLGYLAFDAGYNSTNYTYLDMNGRTLSVTLAATWAARHGIIVCNSAGNNYHNVSVNTLNGPADADSIITVGAVDNTGTIAYFSSQGPTTDSPSRIKPDVCAMGEDNYVATPSGTSSYTTGSGTSFSCPLTAGVAALVLSANKSLTPIQVRDILKKFGDHSSSPGNLYGWGVIDAQKSVDTARKLDTTSPTIVHTQPYTSTGSLNAITLKARVYDNGIIRYSRSDEAPRIYYRKKVSGTWSSYSSANYTSVSLDTFYFQLPSSTSGTTSIEYYFAAQDIALPTALCTTLPAGGSGVTPPGSTAPTTRFTFTITDITPISSTVPDEYKLFNNYPNPFNPSTSIKFNVRDTRLVTLKVYDITGKLVSTLVNQKLQAGEYKVEFSNKELASGIYIYRIEAGDFKDTKKMMLIK
jgi:serine protease AprX